MTTIYLIDPVGLVSGPVKLPVVPGLGLQLPSNAIQLTEALKPPADGHAWCLRGEKLAQLPDHRGTVYRTTDGTPFKHDQLGELPAGLTSQPRPSEDDFWTGAGWAFDPAAQQLRITALAEKLHASKTQLINTACEGAITSNFWSAALGDRHQYSSQLGDQLNLTGAVALAVDMPYACRDEQGLKAFRLHTAQQLRQVTDDLTLFKLQLLQKANELKQQLDQALAANDLAALEAVTWESVQ
ncbi:hypothetical protein ACIPIN_19895 [Pseudomonas sp. NPDC087697]|uniref:DUF4376 domain-containing protein n=1 Tax=Pseudomonas sp. NPDC087697 TaxID=3364447 RepID=UPI0038072E35